MNRFILILLIGTVALLSGCFSNPLPQARREPFALPTAMNPTHKDKDLALGLILSDNAKNAVQHAEQYSQTYQRHTLAVDAAGKVFEDIFAMFLRQFKTVVKIEKVEDAKAHNVDLVAVLDVYLELPSPSNPADNVRINLGAKFLTTDNTQIDVATTESVSTFSWSARVADNIQIVSRDAIRKLEVAISSSVKLAEFSKSATKTSAMVTSKPQAPPAAVGPAARVIPSDIDDPSFEATAKLMGEQDVAVVIGVEKYQDLPASDFSSRDAKLVKEYLVSLGVRERNIELLVNERATQSSIRKSLESWLPNRVKKDSKVFVYYSGHGAPDPATGEAYLVPHDGDANYLSTTGYPLKVLYEKLGALPAGEIVVVLDACFSGAGGRSVLAKGARPLVVVAEGPRLTPNMAVLAATAGAQISTSSPDKGHGILTYYFLKAIKDGKRDLAEIYSTIKPQVEDEAKLLNVAQTPSLNPDPEKLQGKFRLRK
jgi:hypothetical protein